MQTEATEEAAIVADNSSVINNDTSVVAEPSYSNDNSVTECVCETAEVESKKTVCESNMDIDKDKNVPGW